MTHLADLPAHRQLDLIRSREVSPVELAEACLARVEQLNPRINAVCTLSPRVLEDAREAEQALAKGAAKPLHGLPVGIKDVTETAGLLTTYGSPLFRDHVPPRDALVVTRLRQAGAVVLGKTNTPEFAAGGHTFNEIFGVTRNPWNTELSAGGSTGGGAAALVTGMISLAQGTDLGGSLRIPASFCGVAGLRPTLGVVPTFPTEYVWDTLQVTGPMGRTARDLGLMLEAIAGPSPHNPLSRSLISRTSLNRDLRLAYCPDLAGIGVDPEIEAICRKAAFELRQTGTVVEEIEMDLGSFRSTFLALRGFWMLAHQHGRLDRLQEFGDNLRGNVEAGLQTDSESLAAAEVARSRLCQELARFFENFDHLMTPCMAIPPFPVSKNYPSSIGDRGMDTYVDWIAPTFVLSLTGLPVASIPCGLDQRGLPVGLQILGNSCRDRDLLDLADLVEKANPVGTCPLLQDLRF